MAGTTPAQLRLGEKLWRLIDHSWYVPNANGIYALLEDAFIGNLSLIRPDYLSESDVDQFTDKNGQFTFLKFGIAVLDADAIINQTGGKLNVTSNSYGWPPNTHVAFERKSGGQKLRITHPEVAEITKIANATFLIRHPKP